LIALKPIPYSLIQRLKEIININHQEGTLTMNHLNYPQGKLYNKTKRVIEQSLKVIFTTTSPAVYLGSSWKPSKNNGTENNKDSSELTQDKEKISKEDAIDLLRSGCSTQEIFDCYSGFSKQQLAAFQAHYVTMDPKKEVKKAL